MDYQGDINVSHELVESICGRQSVECTRLTYFRKRMKRKKSSIYMFNFIARVSSAVGIYRKKTSLLAKKLSETRNVRDRDQGVPNPWFTGPPCSYCTEDGEKQLLHRIHNGPIRSHRVETRSDISALDGCEGGFWRGSHFASATFSPPTFGAVKTYN